MVREYLFYMEYQEIQAFVLISSIVLVSFVFITVYLIVKLKLNDILLKKSEEKLRKFNDSLQTIINEKTVELRKSEKRFKLLYELNEEILDNSPAGIIKYDKNHKVEFANLEIKNIFNLSDIEFTELIKSDIEKVHKFKEIGLQHHFKILSEGKRVVYESNFILANEEKRFVEIKGSSLSEDENFAGAVILINDITESVLAEQKLQQSYAMLRKATGDIIQAMASTSEMRDPYTAGHQQRVANLAMAIAKKMNVSGDQFEGIKFAGIIHDIGKVSVPTDILTRPGKITEMEFAVIKNHSQAGYDILKKIEFPWPIAEIVYQHHERLDGLGYPRGLKGDDIRLEARILSTADVVEAMTSHRPYREALGIDVALAEIEKFKDERYDVDVVNACKSLFESGEFTF